MIAALVLCGAAYALSRAVTSMRRARGGTIDLAHPVAWRALGGNRRSERQTRS